MGEDHDQALEYAAKAVSLDNTDSRAQLLLGCVLMERVDFEQAKVHLERTLELNPNDADAVAYMGVFLEQTGEFDQAIDRYTTAMRLNPFYPAWYLWQLGVTYYAAKRYAEALMPLKEAIGRNPKFMRPRRTLAATYAQLGHIEEARTVVEEILADQPHASLKQERELYFNPYKTSWDLEHWLEGLRKAGLPE